MPRRAGGGKKFDSSQENRRPLKLFAVTNKTASGGKKLANEKKIPVCGKRFSGCFARWPKDIFGGVVSAPNFYCLVGFVTFLWEANNYLLNY